MQIVSFKTVSDDLIEVAEAALDHLVNEGYAVAIEERQIGYPLTPTFVARRGHETLIVEVGSSLARIQVDRWLRFCKSQADDTRFQALVLRTGLTADCATVAKDRRFGLAHYDNGKIQEIRASVDLAVNVELPPLRELCPPVRPLLAPAFKKIDEGDWRDGLSHAFLEVEQHAREYLHREIVSNVLKSQKPIRKKKPIEFYTAKEVSSMTLGSLAYAYAGVSQPNAIVSTVGQVLAMINSNRVGLAHKRKNAGVEAELRKRVGQHMYAAIQGLEAMLC